MRSLFAYMRKLAKEGVAMIFTSHRLWEVLEICDDIVVFRNGENVGAMDFAKDGRDPEAIVRMITGETEGIRTTKEYYDIPDDPVLTVQGLTYGKYLRDISFRLRKGEVLGIGGLAGQGQNELMLALAGNYPEVSGSVEIGGEQIRLNRPSNAVRSGVLLVPGDRQKEGLFTRNSIYYNMIYPKLGLKKQPFFTLEKQYRAGAEEFGQGRGRRRKAGSLRVHHEPGAGEGHERHPLRQRQRRTDQLLRPPAYHVRGRGGLSADGAGDHGGQHCVPLHAGPVKEETF